LYLGLQGANSGLDLLLLALHSRDFSLVPIENRQRHTEEQPHRIALSRKPLLPEYSVSNVKSAFPVASARRNSA
jgi:hypothetical protein